MATPRSPKVVIFAASQPNPAGVSPVEVDAIFFGFPDINTMDLQGLVNTLCSVDDICAFAVHLSRATTSYVGIILLGSKSKFTDAVILQKAGVYQIGYAEDQILALLENGEWPLILAARKVRWIVC